LGRVSAEIASHRITPSGRIYLNPVTNEYLTPQEFLSWLASLKKPKSGTLGRVISFPEDETDRETVEDNHRRAEKLPEGTYEKVLLQNISDRLETTFISFRYNDQTGDPEDRTFSINRVLVSLKSDELNGQFTLDRWSSELKLLEELTGKHIDFVKTVNQKGHSDITVREHGVTPEES